MSLIADHARRKVNAWREAARRSVVWNAAAPIRSRWLAAERAIERATARADAGRVDAALARALAGSGVATRAGGIVDAVAAAWAASLTRQSLARIAAPFATAGTIARAPVIGTAVIVAAVTVLALRPFGVNDGPLTWLVPAVALLLGVGLHAVVRHPVR